MYGLPDSLKPLSAAEEQVLLAVWSCKPPASRRDIGERLAEKGWKPATVLNFLYRLEATIFTSPNLAASLAAKFEKLPVTR